MIDPSRPSLGLGVHYNSHDSSISASTPAMFEPELLTSPTPSVTSQSRPKKSYPLLAPNISSQSPKRSRPDDDDKDSVSSGADKRRRVTSSGIPNIDLAEEDKFLVQLKEEEDLPWKNIAARFTSHYGRTFQVAALQMRYKRLRERHRAWTAEDLEALRSAHEYWEKAKWDIISAKVWFLLFIAVLTVADTA